MGGKVTLLEVQKGNRERVNVYLDGEFAFGLTALQAAALRKGQELSDSEIRTLKARDSVAKALDNAVRYLTARPRSQYEIRQYLSHKGTATAAIEEVIERLQTLGYVDDVAFARFWVSNRDEFKPRGRVALRYELRQKGIADDAIEEVLSTIDLDDSAYRAAQKKLSSLRGLDTKAARDKLGAFLARRGFSYDTVQRVIERLIQEGEADDSFSQLLDE